MTDRRRALHNQLLGEGNKAVCVTVCRYDVLAGAVYNI